jgi:DNA modification methylase
MKTVSKTVIKRWLAFFRGLRYSLLIVISFGALPDEPVQGLPMGEIRVTCKTADSLPYDQIEPLQGNLKERTPEQLEKICRSIIKHGWAFPEFIWHGEGKNYCLDGHGRQEAIPLLIKKGYTIPRIPIVYIKAKDKAEAKELLLKCISQFGTVTKEGFVEFLDFNVDFLDFEIPGISFGDLNLGFNGKNQSLAERFIVPPLSVLRVASGYWQNRKKAWLSLGIQSEKGRNDGMLKNMASLAKKANGTNLPTESIFDPVLCEVLYRWFCPAEGQILDPFAGGSVRGIIAGYLDYAYTGIDLRQEQIEANLSQIDIAQKKKPLWMCGDSRDMDNHLPHDFEADFVFSCPPYADLEVYSKQAGDLSNMDYSDFKAAYFDIIKKACSRLKEDSFAVFVVGEARSKSGSYYGIVPDTIRAFEDAGLYFYNEMILVTQIAAKALTAAEGFVKSRKIGKIHQNILVFIKGDPTKAALKCKIDTQELEAAISEHEKADAEVVSA